MASSWLNWNLMFHDPSRKLRLMLELTYEVGSVEKQTTALVDEVIAGLN